mgnify:FL=1
MLCELCHMRPATVHFTNIVNNQKVEMHICEQCANEKAQFGFVFPSFSTSLNGLITELLGFDIDSGNSPKFQNQYLETLTRRKQCEKCGMTMEEFLKVGKVGCSNCYTAFEEKLNPLIRRLQGSVKHNGKVPDNVARKASVNKKIEELKELLNKAIEREEYEKAAELRDQIKSLEVSLNDDGGNG